MSGNEAHIPVHENKNRENFNFCLFPRNKVPVKYKAYTVLFHFQVDITNDIHSGNMPVSLHVDSQMSECKNTSSKAGES